MQPALRRRDEPSGDTRFYDYAFDAGRRQNTGPEQPAASLILLVMMRGRAVVRKRMIAVVIMPVRLDLIARRSGEIAQAQDGDAGRSRGDRSHRRKHEERVEQRQTSSHDAARVSHCATIPSVPGTAPGLPQFPLESD